VKESPRPVLEQLEALPIVELNPFYCHWHNWTVRAHSTTEQPIYQVDMMDLMTTTLNLVLVVAAVVVVTATTTTVEERRHC